MVLSLSILFVPLPISNHQNLFFIAHREHSLTGMLDIRWFRRHLYARRNLPESWQLCLLECGYHEVFCQFQRLSFFLTLWRAWRQGCPSRCRHYKNRWRMSRKEWFSQDQSLCLSLMLSRAKPTWYFYLSYWRLEFWFSYASTIIREDW